MKATKLMILKVVYVLGREFYGIREPPPIT
jgi:hypothetical protein